MALDLQTVLGANLGQVFKDVIGEFKESAEDKAKFQAAVDANSAVLAQKQIEYQEKLEDSYQHELDDASANIRAEAATGDKYTSRSRPTFLYVIEIILGWNYIAVPLFHGAPIPLPSELLELFGFCMLGYTGARTWEKISAGAPATGK
jgi:hypothetical protein